MLEIRQTIEYGEWFDGLRDRQAQARINARIRRLSLGNLGDVRPVGEGVSELRIDSITDPATECISCNAVRCSSCSWRMATNARRTGTFKRRWHWRATCRN